MSGEKTPKNSDRINARLFNHGIDCPCNECEKIRKLLRDGINSGEIYLVGLEKDKRKILEQR